MVKNLPVNAGDKEMRVQSLGGEDPLGECMATHSSILAWRSPMDRGALRVTVHGVAESQTRLGGKAHSPRNLPSKLAHNTEQSTLYFNHEKEKFKGNSRR